MSEQRLKRVTPADRVQIAYSTNTNRRSKENWEREQKRRKGAAVCTWCGQEPCGHLWTQPAGASMGDPPGGERCCDKCSHEPVEGWQHTHTAWDGKQHYPVCSIPMRAGDVVYMRRDGVVQFIEMAVAPVEGEAADSRASCTVALLGRAGGQGLYVKGDGGATGTNLWEFARELGVVWIPARIALQIAEDEARRARIAAEIRAIAEEHDRKTAERDAADAARRAASIEKKALAFETRIVKEELSLGGGAAELDAEDDADAPELDAPAAEAAPPVNLKDPVPVKQKGSGRPKRSWRQRRARERQKRAWIQAEARSRLEVKRLERAARIEPKNLVKEK